MICTMPGPKSRHSSYLSTSPTLYWVDKGTCLGNLWNPIYPSRLVSGGSSQEDTGHKWGGQGELLATDPISSSESAMIIMIKSPFPIWRIPTPLITIIISASMSLSAKQS